VPNPISLESISACLPPEGQAWLNGLNPFCRRAVEHDLRNVGPDLFVEYWRCLRDTLEKLERKFGPSDHWKEARDHIVAALLFSFFSADRCCFSQELIIERAVASASLCVPRNCSLFRQAIAQRINSHAPLLSRDPYSDCVVNASMLHK